MLRSILAMLALAATLALLPERAEAYACARGVYRAGCAGPNGAVVVRRPPAYYGRPAYYGGYRGGYYRRPPAVACGAGPYRAGCVRRY